MLDKGERVHIPVPGKLYRDLADTSAVANAAMIFLKI